MEMKKVLAGWSNICPGCNIGRKYPDSFIGKKVRKLPTINEFAISREEWGCHASEIIMDIT